MIFNNIRTVPAGEVFEILTLSGLIIEMFRSFKFSGERDGINGFRPAKITKDDKVHWFFKKNPQRPFEFAELIEYGDEYVLAIRDKFSVSSIVRVNDLGHSATAMLKGKVVTIGGSSVEELLDIKIAVAMDLGIEYWKTPEEESILVERAKRAREMYQEQVAKQAKERAEDHAKREAKKASISARKNIEVWSKTGQKMFGTPVEGDEWKCLPHDRKCILTKDGVPVEAFIVKKDGSKVTKFRETEVSAEMPKQSIAEGVQAMPEILDQVTVTIRGESHEVIVFEERAVLQHYKTRGLNSNTLIGILPKGSEFLDVYIFSGGDYKSFGQLKRKSVQQLEA